MKTTTATPFVLFGLLFCISASINGYAHGGTTHDFFNHVEVSQEGETGFVAGAIVYYLASKSIGAKNSAIREKYMAFGLSKKFEPLKVR